MLYIVHSAIFLVRPLFLSQTLDPDSRQDPEHIIGIRTYWTSILRLQAGSEDGESKRGFTVSQVILSCLVRTSHQSFSQTLVVCEGILRLADAQTASAIGRERTHNHHGCDDIGTHGHEDDKRQR